jgi:hypothetical protein
VEREIAWLNFRILTIKLFLAAALQHDMIRPAADFHASLCLASPAAQRLAIVGAACVSKFGSLRFFRRGCY